MTACIFCDILANLAPANFVQRDELCAAFMDIRPVNPGHVLVVPRTHAILFTELDKETVGHMFQVAQWVDTALRGKWDQMRGCQLVSGRWTRGWTGSDARSPSCDPTLP